MVMMVPSYRSILARVAATAGVLALAVGVVAFLVELELIDDRISAQAKRRSSAFLAQARELAVGPSSDIGVDERLRRLAVASGDFEEGRFVVAEYYDVGKRKIGDYVAPGAEWAEERLKQNRHEFPPPGGFVYDRFFLNGVFFLQTVESLAAEDGTTIGYLESVFEVDRRKSQEIVHETIALISACVLVVLATAAVLTPIFVAFNRSVTNLSRRLLDANVEILSVLGGAVAKKDSDTHAHNFRVTILAIRLAEALDLDEAAMRRLIKGAFLHDVGKIAIPDHILLKPGKLDAAEFTVMKTHVEHGLDIIRPSAWLADAVDVVGGHHEKFDGSGYPAGQARTGIPLSARIFAVVDVFDALTSKRPYKEAMTLDQAMTIITAGSGQHFDPLIVERFAGLVGDLHQRLTALGDDGVEGEMRACVARYFAGA